jgi:hypothetical protein
VIATPAAGTAGGATVPPSATESVPREACGDARDTLMAAYAEHGVPLQPRCADFTRTRRSEFFGFADLFRGDDDSWALLRQPLVIGRDSGYGLDLLRYSFGAEREINSSYRDPQRNAKAGGAKRSRHLFGDAADVRNVTKSQEEWDRMWTAAEKAQADYIEPLTGPCRLNCLHADWRNHTGDYVK